MLINTQVLGIGREMINMTTQHVRDLNHQDPCRERENIPGLWLKGVYTMLEKVTKIL